MIIEYYLYMLVMLFKKEVINLFFEAKSKSLNRFCGFKSTV